MQQKFRRQQLYNLLGDLPDRYGPSAAKKISEQEYDGYILEKLILNLNGREDVPAYFARPKALPGKAPIVIYNHAHGGNYQMGKEEFIGSRDVLQDPSYAKVLTELGYCAICIDTWIFGERSGREELDLFKEMLWKGQVLWGMMVYDTLRAIDYVVTREEVDADRMATFGISMGSTMAWWVAALDERIKVCVDICCLTDFHTLIEVAGLKGHGIYYFVPNLLKHFTTAQINALIAPRSHLSLAGDRDSLTPPKGLDLIDAKLKKVYEGLGVPERWKLIHEDVGHQETPTMRFQILAFLEKWL